MNNDARGSIPPPETMWHGHQGAGLHPTMNLPGPQGQQEQSITPGHPGGGQISMPGLQGQQGQSPATGPPWGGTDHYARCGDASSAGGPTGRGPNCGPPYKQQWRRCVQCLEWNYLSRILGNFHGP